ncbi:MAG: type II toxin-antitoxin system YafQ family toxin [Cyanothece sp. SIO2G6]|nr:type II toxin-antitoxin system YafQ family toxin [Cyanothece sp. SIO2G6]
MLRPIYSKRFKQDKDKMLSQGKDIEKIKTVMRSLINEEPLPGKYRDHKLVGNYKDRRECHIEPDWLLIYKKTSDAIIFERTGSHSELFK